MQRYFFHQITRSGILHDPDGAELPDLEHACMEAIKDARYLMSSAIKSGRDISSRSMQMCDEAGTVLQTIRFTEAISEIE
jgi:hypothetical protein